MSDGSSAQPADMRALWTKIEKIFTNRAFMRPSLRWVWALSDRSGPNRLTRLERSGPAKRLDGVLKEVTPDTVRRLMDYAEVNLEQAGAALRLTLIANVSVPLGALVSTNQLAPGFFAAITEGMDAVAVSAAIFTGLLSLLLLLWYTYAGFASARDLVHLLKLRLAGSGTRLTSESYEPEPGILS